MGQPKNNKIVFKKIHSCFIAILNASLTINLNGIFM